MNSVTLSGRLVKDAELKYSASGTAIYNNTVAVEDGYGDNKKTYFIDFVAFQKTAENAAQWTFKGQRVILQGKLVKRSYEANDGKKIWITEVHASNLEYTDFKEKEETEKKPKFNEKLYENPFANAKSIKLDESDLPF